MLNLAGPQKLSAKAVVSICAGLASAKSALRELTLIEVDVNEKAASYIAGAMKTGQLTRVVLKQCGLHKSSVAEFAFALQSVGAQVRVLDLARNKLAAEVRAAVGGVGGV